MIVDVSSIQYMRVVFLLDEGRRFFMELNRVVCQFMSNDCLSILNY